jgi:hypothetical protein
MAGTVTKNEPVRDDFVSGKIVCDGAATNVELGFVPKQVEIQNITNPSTHRWYYGMTAAYCIQEAADGVKSVVTSAGISGYAGDATHAPGFTIGTNAVLNTASDVLYFKAFRH